jgi:co-chaperonin GroES (HSP10)
MKNPALEEAFPECDPGVFPLGSRILVQIKTPETKSKGGIILTESDKDTQMWNTTVAKVIATGPLAFHNRDTLKRWPEGDWCKVGDYVRVPRYGGDRWVCTNKKGEKAYYILINDLDILALVTTDPLEIKAFF